MQEWADFPDSSPALVTLLWRMGIYSVGTAKAGTGEIPAAARAATLPNSALSKALRGTSISFAVPHMEV